MGKTTIALKKETKEKLKKIGYKGETYDEIVSTLLDIAKKGQFLKKQERILKNERFVKLEEI